MIYLIRTGAKKTFKKNGKRNIPFSYWKNFTIAIGKLDRQKHGVSIRHETSTNRLYYNLPLSHFMRIGKYPFILA